MKEPRVCLVAGVGPGIGSAVAQRFAREGFAIALLARRERELAEHARHLEAHGGTALAVPVDLGDAEAVAAAVARAEQALGGVEVAIYNASLWRPADPMTLPIATFQYDLAVSATGALAVAQAVYPGMRARGHGSLLFTGGGLALHPAYGSEVPSLTAGKSALRGLVLAMASRLAADGIHVATITVAGLVARGTELDPALIAEDFWALHSQPRGQWDAELVLPRRSTPAG